MGTSMIHEASFEGLNLRTGDIICTCDGAEEGVAGRLWRAVGHLVPGEIDHIAVYLGPGGRCVEAGARGVTLFEMPPGRWDAAAVAADRLLIDTLVGAAYPLEGRGLSGEAEAAVRAGVASYCLEQVAADKPYNFNIFDQATEAAFYCSQLVYRAYLSQGIDLTSGASGLEIRDEVPLVLPQVLWQRLPHRRVAAPQAREVEG